MKIEEISFQEECDEFVKKGIYCNQTTLVGEMLESGVFEYGNIINLRKTKKDLIDEGCSTLQIEDENCLDMKEIYEWWLCSDWLIERLEEKKECILKNDFGEWWGRQMTGQSLKLDGVIRQIVKEIKGGE